MADTAGTRTEIIAIASGKGGTGKTLFGACLGFALTYSGHRTLLVDGDLATYGQSLFLLGPNGKTAIQKMTAESTWRALLEGAVSTPQPAKIDRDLKGDPSQHGVRYEALIADLGIYGDRLRGGRRPGLERARYRTTVGEYFDRLRAAGEFDYVLIDTRGGFTFESTDLCALADSFIIVTDADYTSFYQDRNLLSLVSDAAKELERRPLLRSIVVNRATEEDERSFRLELTREFPILFEQTHAIPLDIEVFKAYKTQAMPLVSVPASHFCHAMLGAFAEILSIVTAEWPRERVTRWNELVDAVSKAIEERNAEAETEQRKRSARLDELERLSRQSKEAEETIARLQRELERVEAAHARELERVEKLHRAPPETAPPDVAANGPESPRTKQAASWFSVERLGLVAFAALLIGYLALVWYPRQAFDRKVARLYERTAPVEMRVELLGELFGAGHRDFKELHLEGAQLGGLRLAGANLQRVDFTGADLREADLQDAVLREANLRDVDLRSAQLRRADLTGAKLDGADLSGADLSDADLDRASLVETSLRGADLRGASVATESLAYALLDAATRLPVELEGPAAE